VVVVLLLDRNQLTDDDRKASIPLPISAAVSLLHNDLQLSVVYSVVFNVYCLCLLFHELAAHRSQTLITFNLRSSLHSCSDRWQNRFL